VDALSNLLTDVRADGALFDRTVMRPPWAVRFADGAPLTLVVPLSGTSWIHPGDGPAVQVGMGDIAIVTGTAPFTLADRAEAPVAPRVVMRRPGDNSGLTGRPQGQEPPTNPWPCGDRDDGAGAVMTGTYHVRGLTSERLLSALPRVLVVPDEHESCPLLHVTLTEVARRQPGQQAVLDRLLDLLLLTTVREWFDRPESTPPTWYTALSDPLVGTALRRLQDEQARPWTVATLAAEVGVSRAALARRFTELVGEPPMTYLTGWRLAQAADLLQRTELSVDAVARQVGYRSGYALSTAFKRVHGVRPSDYRAGFAPPDAGDVSERALARA
jgi:AraC-like DNA-binding protein